MRTSIAPRRPAACRKIAPKDVTLAAFMAPRSDIDFMRLAIEAARGLGEAARMRDMGGAEVDAPELAAAGGRVNVQRNALAESELQVAKRARAFGGDRMAQQRERKHPRLLLGKVPICVGMRADIE